MSSRRVRGHTRRACLGLLAGLPALASAQEPPPLVSMPALSLLGGGAWTSESWSGVAGVLCFFTLDCPYCHRHNARLDLLHRQAAPGLRVLGLIEGATADAAREHVLAQGWRFAVALAPDGLRAGFTPRRVTPMTVTFDRQHRLQERIPGEMSQEDVLGLARRLT
jgi:hypothetical protein